MFEVVKFFMIAIAEISDEFTRPVIHAGEQILHLVKDDVPSSPGHDSGKKARQLPVDFVFEGVHKENGIVRNVGRLFHLFGDLIEQRFEL